MTVTHSARVTHALLLGLVVLAVVASPVAAHAELVSSDPADKSEVEAPFDGPIVLTFDEPLAPGSKADLKDGTGATIASATVDGDELVFALDDPLGTGQYTIQWTSVGADRDVERGTITFSVVPPPPTPTPAPTATPGPTATAIPTPSPAPTRSPTPSGNGTVAGGPADVLFPLLGVVIAVVALGALLLRNRRSAGR
ncbi:MAG TPA: copper resistance protein CopC [Candidatus Limnocylindrales bacterium]|nr:copper resistance protein CopC [Candidatus Limnocylindrales bacterium]